MGMQIDVVYARAESQSLVTLDLDEGATVGLALEAVAPHPRFEGLDLAAATVGLHGVLVDRRRVLRQGDRVELYRPLEMDPKEARRRRAKH